ncbi:hypothetical protein ACNQKP_13870 [Bdellovibrio bacteriovorus]|uniref:hypothetical protein n=1 Tax=Bdellovibrio bacteriovorus TaxID=959 RepID=UPI003AA84017
MALIQCKAEIPAVEGLKDNELTVGREFLLVCDGEFPRDLQQEKLHFVLKPEQKYQIKLLGFEFRSPTLADIKATAYTAGNIPFENLQLSDGVQTLDLGPIQYGVTSVLPPPPQNPGEQPVKQEPYGPIGPASIGVPMLYWGILAAFLGVIALIAITKIYRVIQRRNMLERLREHDSALTPLSEFHQNYRRLQRANPVFFGKDAKKEEIEQVLVETNKMFKLFLTRQFRVPALEWSERLVIKDIKKYHRNVYVEAGEGLLKLFHEYQHAFADKQNLSSSDVLNLATHCRTLVEKMERVSS